MTHAIAIHNLSYTYRKAARPALQEVSLDIQPGEMFALLGPNGGGKSTLFRLMATLLPARPGQVIVAGADVATTAGADRVRNAIGVVFQQPSLDDLLTVWENITVQAALYGLAGAVVAQRGQRWLEAFDLWDRRNDRAGTLSGGLKRRLEIAKTLLHEPDILLLDEPTTGVDPVARRQFWQDLQQVRSERPITVVVTTHLLEEAERCGRVAILSSGRLIAIDTPDALKARVGGEVVTLKLRHGDEGLASATALLDQLQQRGAPWPDGAGPRLVDDTIYFEREHGAAAVAQFADVIENRVDEIRISRPTLEDVFVHLTGQKLA